MTLNFQRQPFQAKQVTVMVPWNRLVTMDAVTMMLEEEDEVTENVCPGVVHDHYNMRPVVLSTWQHTQLGSCPEMSTVIPESQVGHTSQQLPFINTYIFIHQEMVASRKKKLVILVTILRNFVLAKGQ